MNNKNLLFALLAMLSWFGMNAQNNCLEFDGSEDYVSCGNILTNSSPLEEFTIEFWMKLHSTQPYYMGVFGQQTTAYSSDNFSISFYCGDDPNRFGMTGSWSDDVSGDLPGDRSSFDNRTTMPFGTGVWKHVANTFDGTTMKMYVDGVLIKESDNYGGDSYAGKSLGNTHDFLLGKTLGYGSGVTTHFFDGELDEFRIWDDARTETEIRQNMYQELPDASGEPNLVAYYKFDETSGITLDDSKGSHDGALTNMSGNEWQTSPAIFGPKNALDFDGDNDYVSISNLYMSGSAFTVETWVYFDSFNGAGDDNITILFRGGDENICLRIGDGDKDNNMPQFVVTISGQQKLNANARLSTSTWYHLAGVYDGENMYLYINGELDKSQSQTGSISTTTNAFGLGGAGRNHDGQMDEVRIWSDARTASEIRENMCKNLTGNESGLVAYYNNDTIFYDAGTELNKLPDYSGNGNDGIVLNGTTTAASSAFNTWLNTDNSAWSTASNWSRGSDPTSSDNVGVYSYVGGTNATLSGPPTVNHLLLGSSSSMTLSSGITVNGNLILESDVDLNGQNIFMGTSAYLIEDAGRIYGTSGLIRTIRNLSNISAENIAGLGAEITTAANMGSTTISRSHAANSSPASIERRYSITPTNNSGLNATLVFHYNANELNSLTESYLELSKSTDGGNIWTNQESSVNTFVKTITLSGIDGFSLWTAMESANTTPPIVNTDDPTHSFTTGTTAITIAPNTTVTTTSDIENATISISPIVPEDILSVSGLAALGLSSSWDNTTKILAISGTGSASDYQTALRNVKFETTATSEGTRTIDFILGDGVGLMISGEQHFYEVIYESGNISWTDARLAALAKRFGAAQGYLATITSITENDYLYDKLSEDTWIGASDAETEDVWKWIDGPETGIQFWQGDASGSAVNGMYENWAGGEPNDAFSNEDYAHMYCREDLQGVWNDYSNTNNVKYYIVEYGGDGSTFTSIDDATINVKSDITWDGSEGSDWNTAENWNYDVVPTAYCNITIPDAATNPVIGPTETVDCNNLSIISGGSLTIESGSSGTGSLIVNGTLSNSGTISMQRYFPGATLWNWHMVSSPMDEMAISTSNFIVDPATNYDFYAWNEPSPGTWINYKTSEGQDPTFLTVNGSDNFEPGNGYLVAYNEANPTKLFTGTLNAGSQTFTLKNSGGKDWTYTTGWNFLGNPYSSSIDWNLVDRVTYFQDNYAYVYDPAANAGAGDYVEVNGADVNAYIAPNQGFFVMAKTSANNQTFTFTNAIQTHGGSFMKAVTIDQQLVLRLSDELYYDEIQFRISEQSTFNRDREDAIKLYSYNPVAPQLLSYSDDLIPLAVNTIPEVAAEKSMLLGLRAPKTGAYTLSVSEMSEAFSANSIYLEDLFLNNWHKLNESAYSFISEEGDISDRFLLHFGVVGIEEPTSIPPSIQLWTANHTLYLLNPDNQEGKVRIINMYGQKVMETPLNRKAKQQMKLDAPAGYYIVNVVTKTGVVNKKVYLK